MTDPNRVAELAAFDQALAERWEIALTARCGLPSCNREPGERCVNVIDGAPRDEPHWNRWARGLSVRGGERDA